MARTHNNNVSILHWNCQGIRNKKDLLLPILHRYDIILLSETKLPHSSNLHFPGFSTLQNNRLVNRGGGLAIAIRENLPFSIIDTTYNAPNVLETLTIKFPTALGDLHIINLYRPPYNPFNHSNWTHLLDSVANLDNVIIAGDFNCHHEAWGSNHACPTAKSLVHLLDSDKIDLVILNDGSPTHINKSSHSLSCIDLTLASPPICPLASWTTLSDSMGSDHFPIQLTIGATPCSFPPPTHGYYLRKTDWGAFRQALTNDLSNPSHSQTLSPPLTKYDNLINLIDSAIIKSSPPHRPNTNPTRRKKNAPWWNDRCAEANSQRKKALSTFRKTPNCANCIALKKTEASAKKTFNQEKRLSWRRFCESLNHNTPLSTVWNSIKGFRNRYMKPLPQFTNDSTTIKNMEEFKNNLCKPSTPSLLLPPVAYQSDPYLDSPFSLQELKTAIIGAKARTAPGLDHINYQIIQNLPPPVLTALLEIFNSLLEEGSFPDSWKEFIIILIPKPKAGSFRPISLASCMLKLLEKLIQTRLIWWTEHHDVLPGSQYGFRKKRSCADNLALITTEINTGYVRHEYTPAVFLDISGAFDNVAPDILVQSLAATGIPQKYCKFIHNLCNNRKLFFKINGSLSQPHSTSIGLPQGSVLSPILYNLYVKDIEQTIDERCSIIQFADDIAIFSRSKDLAEALTSIQSSIDNITAFLTNRKLQLSPTKTSMVIFTNRYIPPNSNILLNDTPIFPSNSAKFLGLHLDSKLKWKPHLNHLINRSRKIINIIKALRATWWGADPHTLLILYKSLLRSSIEYGCFCFNLDDFSLKNRLQKIQNQAIRLALGYRCSTPINIMHAESNTPPLYIRLTNCTYKFLLKTYSTENHPIVNNLSYLHILTRNHNPPSPILRTFILYRIFTKTSHLQNHIDSHSKPLVYLYTPTAPPTDLIDFNTGKRFTEANSPSPNADFLLYLSSLIPSATHLYTDGSKTDSGMGFAIYSPEFGSPLEFKIPSEASVFTAEAAAILHSILLIIDLHLPTAYIFTDSLSSLQAIASPNLKNQNNRLIFNIRKKLSSINPDSQSIHLVWIPAHQGITGNEIADAAAKRGSVRGVRSIPKIPYSDLFPKAKEHTDSLFQTYINNTKHALATNTLPATSNV